MFTTSKSLRIGLMTVCFFSLSACASQAPRVSNSALGYAVTNFAISADSNEQALSDALGSSLSGIGIATAMAAKANVTIDSVRYNSPIIGFFYGGQHYASLSVELNDNSGTKIGSFPLYVSADGARASADSDLASKAALIIAAKAANAFLPIKAMPKAISKAAAIEPAREALMPPAIEPGDDTAPCVIGPDGKCLLV